MLELAVPDPSLAVGTVPDPSSDALSAVKLAPQPSVASIVPLAKVTFAS